MKKNAKLLKTKAFSLIELMVVIVIIGILAIGYVKLFGSGSTKAMEAKSKDGYSKVVEYITVEMLACNMGETSTMGGQLTCLNRTVASVLSATVDASKNVQMNPYIQKNSAVTSGGNNTADADAGYIRLSASGTNIIVKTCHTKPCNLSENQRSETIALQ